ncbi:hypothetical protein GOBAR_AA21218 [Gossypium barbadense]|uniref:Uncharacterized protein n=1 Tax=Gossypium barbadense TaxID=3634 RepID=A0A2P5X7Z9_GOSBA|nr:hypothetical protein GOBAR_AA21218 [Gossypium barbadense]
MMYVRGVQLLLRNEGCRMFLSHQNPVFQHLGPRFARSTLANLDTVGHLLFDQGLGLVGDSVTFANQGV